MRKRKHKDVDAALHEAGSLVVQQPGRRRVVLSAGLSWVVGGLALEAFAQTPPQPKSLPQFTRYFDSRLDEATGTLLVQAVAWTLSPDTAPATHHLTVLADTLTIEGNVMMPGRNVKLVARNIVVASGPAKISTVGKTGSPTYTKQTASPGQAGARDTGKGQAGGSISIYATMLTGVLALDTSGGVGGDAQNGGRGLPGADGKQGTFSTPPVGAGNGLPGMDAGIPGDGGDAGDILVFTEFPRSALAATASGGNAGGQGSHGEPGPPGATAPAAQGRYHYTVMCTTGMPS